MDAVDIISAVIGILTLVIILAEIYLHLARKRRDYNFADLVTNIQTMFLYQLIGAAALGFIYFCYQWVFDHFRIMEQDITSPYAWIFGFVLADFCHYWFHRTSHKNNFLWGIHQGHHTSEHFNLSIAVRKGIFQQWVDWPFFIPMAFMGYPFLEMFLPLKGLQFAYQFWLHNQFVGRLPVIEKVLVTPSAHRVHHGQNPQYIDKNHAGVFIIWDKLFGTFAEEKEPVVYGTTEPVNSFNAIGIQFVWWKSLWEDAKNTRRWQDKLAIPFRETGWRPADVAAQPRSNHIADLHTYTPFSVKVATKLKIYCVVQIVFIMSIVSSSVGMEQESSFLHLNNPAHIFAFIYLLFTVASLGTLVNQQRFAQSIEWSRIALLLGASLVGQWLYPGKASLFLGVLGLVSAVLFSWQQFFSSASSTSDKSHMTDNNATASDAPNIVSNGESNQTAQA